MKTMFCDISRSTVGRFYVGQDAKLHCLGTALRSNAEAVKALRQVVAPADAVEITEEVAQRCVRAIHAQTEGRLVYMDAEPGEHISASDPANQIEIDWHAQEPAPAAAPAKKSAREDVLDVSANATFERRG